MPGARKFENRRSGILSTAQAARIWAKVPGRPDSPKKEGEPMKKSEAEKRMAKETELEALESLRVKKSENPVAAPKGKKIGLNGIVSRLKAALKRLDSTRYSAKVAEQKVAELRAAIKAEREEILKSIPELEGE